MTVDLTAHQDVPLKAWTVRPFPLTSPWSEPLVVCGIALVYKIEKLRELFEYCATGRLDEQLETRVRFLVDGEALVDEPLHSFVPFRASDDVPRVRSFRTFALPRPLGFDEHTEARVEFEDARFREFLDVWLVCAEFEARDG